MWNTFAHADPGLFHSTYCSVLLIRIINHTQDSCFLLQKDLMAGKLNHEDDLKVIPVERKENYFVSLHSYTAADLSLTYACGTGMATIHVHKDPCIYYEGEVHTTISAITGMNVDYEITPGFHGTDFDFSKLNMFSYDFPGILTWTFSSE